MSSIGFYLLLKLVNVISNQNETFMSILIKFSKTTYMSIVTFLLPVIFSKMIKYGELSIEVRKLRTEVRTYLRSVAKLSERLELEMKK